MKFISVIILIILALTQFSYASDTLEIKIQGENLGEMVTLKVNSTPLSSSVSSLVKYETIDEDQELTTSRFKLLLRNSIVTINKKNMSLDSITRLRDGAFKSVRNVEAFKANTRNELKFFEHLRIKAVSPLNNSVVNLEDGKFLYTHTSTFDFAQEGHLAVLWSHVWKYDSTNPLYFPLVQGERLNLDENEFANIRIRIEFSSQEKVRRISVDADQTGIRSTFKNLKTVFPSGERLNLVKYAMIGSFLFNGSTNYFEFSENGEVIAGALDDNRVYYNGGKYATETQSAPTLYIENYRNYFVYHKNHSVGLVSENLNPMTLLDSMKYLCEEFGISDPLDPLLDTGFFFYSYDSATKVIDRGERYFDLSKKELVKSKAKTNVEFFKNIQCPRSIPLGVL